MDDTDPMVSVMKLEKAPEETYADIGGLDTQIQEIKACSCTCTVFVVCLYMHVCNDVMNNHSIRCLERQG